MSSIKKGRSRREEDATVRKGKAPKGLRSRSEPLILGKSSSVSEVHLLEEDFRTGSQMERGFRASPLFRCHLSRNPKRCSGEGTSSSRGEAYLHNPHFEEDKEGVLGRVGSDFRGSSVTDSPSSPPLRGFAKFREWETWSCPSVLPPNKSKPKLPKEDSNLVTGSQGDTVVSLSGEFYIDGLSPGRWLKCERFYDLWILRFIPGGRTVAPQNSSFTWSNLQESPVYKRLDRFLYSNEWRQLFFPKAFKKPLLEGPRTIGQLFWSPTRSSGGPTPFRFENMWLQHPSFKENFRNWWRGFQGNGWEGHKFMKRLQFVKAKLKKWNKKRSCFTLKSFTTNPTEESWSIEGLDWSPILEETAFRLDSPFTEEEISKAIFQLDRDKALGLDGFNHCSISRLLGCDQGGFSTFVQGRQILDAVLIANEIVDERRQPGEEGVVFKIDFEKAYDHVSWDFLDHVLEKKGSVLDGGKWISGCLSSISYAVLVNGNAKGWVKASRGLRQEERNLLGGFKEEELQTLKSLLLVFGHISGLKVNLDKSNIYGINLDQYHLSRLAELLDCKTSGWPILYLGLPLGGNPKAGGFWDPVIERISRRLDRCGCKNREVAKGLFMSGIGEGKRDHLVSWDVVCKPKAKGGLGFGNISLRNLALLGKWLWRYPREGSALWHQVILSIYGSHSNGWDANTLVRWSHHCP
ncbi:hypothetical protein CK203_080675 [Vitis vinifera]|uniref:Uncharacterized protein n=1 Tax=Vitis vinifera TaxID=29760 RepID=A0A438DZA6_VITVI|nr:hypothetical protein CK203_080675 [Vitis vinifera]